MVLLMAVNGGSSSLKLSLFRLIKGDSLTLILDVHTHDTHIEIKTPHFQRIYPQKVEKVGRSLSIIIKKIRSDLGIDLSELRAIGHRFIHGGNQYFKSTLITDQVLKDLEKLNDLAPLHNPGCISLIKACRRLFGPKIRQVAVFDTAFHHTLPPHAKEYAIPKDLAKRYQIRKYGFHGISHAYLAQKMAEHTQNKKQNLITLHLGGGCSATAIKEGASIDTSMGFSPCSGLIMGTRVGDIDFTVLEYLSKKTKKGIKALTHLLNFESGLLGITAKTSDFQTILKQSSKDPNCRLAIDLFCYRILHYIGAYTAVLNRVDALIFTGGIGENAASLRSLICSKLGWLGVHISSEKNEKAVHLSPGEVHEISISASKVKVYVIATYENALIAQETIKIKIRIGEMPAGCGEAPRPKK